MIQSEEKKKAIASKLITAREYAGLSQGQAAKIMGLHRPTISEIEAGRRNVTAEELARFAEMYKVSVDWLLSEKEGESASVKDRIQLAARELATLKEQDLEKVIKLLTALRKPEDIK